MSFCDKIYGVMPLVCVRHITCISSIACFEESDSTNRRSPFVVKDRRRQSRLKSNRVKWLLRKDESWLPKNQKTDCGRGRVSGLGTTQRNDGAEALTHCIHSCRQLTGRNYLTPSFSFSGNNPGIQREARAAGKTRRNGARAVRCQHTALHKR